MHVFGLQILPVAIALGFFVGLLVGITGMGGASLMTPLLVLFLGVKPVVAVGTDIAYSSISKLAGGIVHARQHTVDWKIAGRLAMGSVPGSILGVLSLGFFKERLGAEALDQQVLHWIGIMLIIVSVVMLTRLLLPLVAPNFRIQHDAPATHIWLPILGFVVGYLVGLTSVGSGSLIVPVLSLFTLLSASTLVGTDIVHAVLLLGVSAVAHFALGSVDIGMTVSLLLGSVPGVLIGSRWCAFVPERPLRFALVAVLLVSASRLI